MSDALVAVFRTELAAALRRRICCAPAYCFMPDHLHVLVQGCHENSDAWLAVVQFKRQTGMWLAENTDETRWQKGFHAKPIEPLDGIEGVALYVWNNPVRAGLAEAWHEYPYSGAIEPPDGRGSRALRGAHTRG